MSVKSQNVNKPPIMIMWLFCTSQLTVVTDASIVKASFGELTRHATVRQIAADYEMQMETNEFLWSHWLPSGMQISLVIIYI